MTLPLIHALQQASPADKRRIIYIVKNQSEQKHKVREVIDFVKRSGGLAYATEAMRQYHEEAKGILQTFPDSEHKRSLARLVAYTIEREK